MSIPEPQAWKLRGAGAYGSDVDVVSLDAYKELAQRCENAEASALMWARRARAAEGGDPTEFAEEARERIVAALYLPVSAIKQDKL